MICHIVLFTPKADLSAVVLRSFAQSIVATFRHISSLKKATVGRAIDIDAGYERSFGDKTYEFAAVLEFTDRAALLGYLNHPLHKELGALFWRHCEATVILEIEATDAKSDDAVELLLSARPPAP
ncbi:MAG TPA: Dabb family protein [Vicinamibacterales bacterium]|nr:Dabb family protein [Vicinamibacterales bacterium]